MTDYSHLIGPKPEPTPSPPMPTPWRAFGHHVVDANGVFAASVGRSGTDLADKEIVAAFVAEAVNEKVARDAALKAFEELPELVLPPLHRQDVEYWKSDDGLAYYRLTPEAAALGEGADLYCQDDGITPRWLSEEYVREHKTPCFPSSVPEVFRL